MGWRNRLTRWVRGTDPASALVIGAGVAGLTCALFLDARGFRTTILERLTARTRRPRSTVLSDAALEGYDSIGLKGLILRASNPFARRVLDVGRRRTQRRPALRTGARVMPHAQLREILDEEVERRWIPVERGNSVLSVEQTPSRVHAVLDSGRRISAPHVVAADGSDSVASTSFGTPSPPRRVRAWSISGVSSTDLFSRSLAERLDPGVAMTASAEHLSFVAHQDDPTDEASIAWSVFLRSGEELALSTVTPEDKADQVANAVRALERLAPDVVGMVRGSHTIGVTAATSGPARSRRLGRVLLVGGAFHGDLASSRLGVLDPYLESMHVPERIISFESAAVRSDR